MPTLIIFVFLIIGYLIGKYLTEQKKWGEKKAELIREYAQKIYEEQKRVLEKENEIKEQENKFQKHISEIKLSNGKLIQDIKIEHEKFISRLQLEYADLIKGARKDSVERSRNTILGKLWEQVAPYTPKFPYHPSDMKFFGGAPIDYVIFDGMTEGNPNKIIFLEIKSGQSTLNTSQRKLKKVIEDKKVEWKEFRLQDLPKLEIPEDKNFNILLKEELNNVKDTVERETRLLKEIQKAQNIEILDSNKKHDEPKSQSFICSDCTHQFDVDKEKNYTKIKCPECGSKKLILGI